jgi:hypothetical protein
MSGRGVRRSGLLAVIVAAASVAAVARAEIRELRVRLPQHPPPTGTEAICTKRLVVARTEGAEGCFVDERVTQTPGVVRYPCAGTGWAKAVFGHALFLGRIENGRVDLVLNTEFDFSDGCVWTTDQRLRGAISGEALDYSYAEGPRPNQRGCSTSCSARARARIEADGASH